MVLVGCGGVSTPAAPGDATPPGTDESEPDVPTEPGEHLLAKSGSRLVAQGYQSQGAVKFRHFHDDALDLPCAFALDSGGTPRCFPQKEVRVVYLDDACSEPAAWKDWFDDDFSEGNTVAGGGAEACPGELRTASAFRVGEELDAGGTFGPGTLKVYAPVNGHCEQAHPDAKSAPAVYRLVPQSDAAFVAARLASLDVGSGLKLQQLQAEDGAELNWGLASADGSACTPQKDGRCLPAALAIPGGASLDASCESLGFYSPLQARCGVPRYGQTPQGRVVELERPERLFSRLPVFPAPADGAELQYTCQPSELFPDVFAPGRDVTDSLLRAAPVLLGNGALKAQVFRVQTSTARYTLSDGSSAELFDTGDRVCRVYRSMDGSDRCWDISQESVESGYFADASCSLPLYVQSGTGPQLRRAEIEMGVLKELYELGSFAGPVFQPKEGRCEAASARGQVLLARGAAIDATSLPLVTHAKL